MDGLVNTADRLLTEWGDLRAICVVVDVKKAERFGHVGLLQL